MKQVIYVTRQGGRVHRDNRMVAVSDAEGLHERWPARHIDRLMLFGDVQITTQAIATLMAEGARVCLFSAAGRLRGQITPPASGNVFVRLAQVQRLYDQDFRRHLAQRWVRTKIRDARAMTLRHRRNHPHFTAQFEAIAARLTRADRHLTRASSLDELRGVEGSAAAAWFEAFGAMVRAPFTFERRTRRPALDPVNAMLNMGYTLIGAELAGLLEAHSFDPRIGFYHGLRYGRHSLALDLLESYRVDVIDRMTLSWLNRRMFSPNDFYDAGRDKGIRFKPESLRRYLGLYEAALGRVNNNTARPSVRTRMALEVATLRREVLEGDTPFTHDTIFEEHASTSNAKAPINTETNDLPLTEEASHPTHLTTTRAADDEPADLAGSPFWPINDEESP